MKRMGIHERDGIYWMPTRKQKEGNSYNFIYEGVIQCSKCKQWYLISKHSFYQRKFTLCPQCAQTRIRYENHFEKYGYIWSRGGNDRCPGTLMPCIKCHKPKWINLSCYEMGIGIHHPGSRRFNKWTGLCQTCYSNSLKSNGKYIKEGYVHIKLYDNPFPSMTNQKGYIAEHRYVMAKHLGRCLNSNELVHHKDGDKSDNNIDNLELTRRGKAHKSSYSDAVAYGMSLMLTILAKYNLIQKPSTGQEAIDNV